MQCSCKCHSQSAQIDTMEGGVHNLHCVIRMGTVFWFIVKGGNPLEIFGSFRLGRQITEPLNTDKMNTF